MSRRKYTKLSELTASEGLERFRRNDSLVHRKLLSYLPFMIATNLATLLLSTVDGVVVGNLVGSEALSAVSIFMPITFVISIVCTWVASGISTALSTGMGDNRIEDLAPLKKAAVTVTIVSALAVAVLEFPVAAILVRSYHLTPDMQGMVWQYGIGILISMPFGLASTVCVHELMILGKSEILTAFAITEGCVNLVLDLLFVGVFHMGIAGAASHEGCRPDLQTGQRGRLLQRHDGASGHTHAEDPPCCIRRIRRYNQRGVPFLSGLRQRGDPEHPGVRPAVVRHLQRRQGGRRPPHAGPPEFPAGPGHRRFDHAARVPVSESSLFPQRRFGNTGVRAVSTVSSACTLQAEETAGFLPS